MRNYSFANLPEAYYISSCLQIPVWQNFASRKNNLNWAIDLSWSAVLDLWIDPDVNQTLRLTRFVAQPSTIDLASVSNIKNGFSLLSHSWVVYPWYKVSYRVPLTADLNDHLMADSAVEYSRPRLVLFKTSSLIEQLKLSWWLLFTKTTHPEYYTPLQTAPSKMYFRILLALFAFTSLSIADGSPDDDVLDKRLSNPPGCFCCTGYVVKNIAGTRCGHGE